MVEIKDEQAKAIADLVLKIKNVMTLDHVIVGIPTDGVPIVKSVAYILKNSGEDSSQKLFSYLAASSKYKFIDAHRLNAFKLVNRPLIFVDWRTVSGELGNMLKENYPNSTYAVLSDSNNKADICATSEDIPKFDFPANYEGTLETIGLWIEPHTVEELLKLKSTGGEIEYSNISTKQSEAFYKNLFEKIDDYIKK